MSYFPKMTVVVGQHGLAIVLSACTSPEDLPQAAATTAAELAVPYEKLKGYLFTLNPRRGTKDAVKFMLQEANELGVWSRRIMG